MSYSARLFIDFWNFSLNWRDRVSSNEHCDWTKLPGKVVAASQGILHGAGLTEPVELNETLVYASIDAPDTRLKGWLDTFLNRLPSFRVTVKERSLRPAKLHCRNCGQEIERCAQCGTTYVRSAEKGIDTQIVTDLLSLAWQGAFDVAVLLTTDADFVPAVIRVQEKGLKVINASWSHHGHELKKTCWASFDLESIMHSLYRT